MLSAVLSENPNGCRRCTSPALIGICTQHWAIQNEHLFSFRFQFSNGIACIICGCCMTSGKKRNWFGNLRTLNGLVIQTSCIWTTILFQQPQEEGIQYTSVPGEEH